MNAFCAVCNRGPLFSWEKHPASTCEFSFCQKCGEKAMAEKVAAHVIGNLTGAELEPTPKGMNCIRCEKPFVGGYLLSDGTGVMCFDCAGALAKEYAFDVENYHACGAAAKYSKLPVPIGGIEFGYATRADEADSNSLRCCHGIAEAPRCPDKADWLTLDTADQWDGQAWCQGHRPVKQKPGCQWWVPLRAVRVER